MNRWLLPFVGFADFSSKPLWVGLSPAILCAAGAEAIAAQNRPSGLGFEWDAVRLTALIANDLESFTFVAAAATALLGSAKGRTARIAARFASLRVAQPALAIIVLLSFGKWEGSATLGASDVQIRH